jgi:hypothetical protein
VPYRDPRAKDTPTAPLPWAAWTALVVSILLLTVIVGAALATWWLQ